MSELQIIHSTLEHAARRRRWTRALRGLWHGLLVGAIITLLLVSIFHVRELPLWALLVAGLVPFPCMLIGLIIGGWRKPPLNQIARWVDGRQKLKERLSTALEISATPTSSAWDDLVMSDAAEHAKGIDTRKMMPFHLPRVTRWALVCLALGAGLGFVPEYRSKTYLQKKTDERNIKEAGRQLADLTRRSLEKRLPAPETQKSMEVVTNLGDQLMKKAFTRSEALKELSSVADKLKDELREMGKDPSLKRMEQAAREGGGKDAQTAASLQKQIESLQKQIGTPTGNPDELDKLKKNIEKAQEAARGLSDKNSPATEAERQKLSESLSALSKQALDLGLQLPQLDDAINALVNNQTDMVLKDLQAATTDLEKLREMTKSLQQLQQQMEKIGKDLAEQLKNGQPEAAQQTLQKMMSALKSSSLSQEKLEKMMSEISKASDPASKYGKVGEHLKAAAQKMKGNDKAGAGQSLAKASDELNKLMQQLGDAQELQSTLDALNEAAMSIGSGQGWSAGRRPGQPKAGKGGKPGSGVGTWAEENAEWDGQTYSGWDNSGVVRPDEDPRGLSERDAELSDALKPSKVKSQFSPGGQMPSITLKGVSIKGTSKLDYETAATAAQSDAQSALSQERVPRAYQGAVKDYFDDLKK